MPLEGERTPSRPRCSRRMRVYSVCKGCTAPHTPLHPTPGSPWKGKRRLWLQTVPGQSLEPGATPGQEQGQGKAPPCTPQVRHGQGQVTFSRKQDPRVQLRVLWAPQPLSKLIPSTAGGAGPPPPREDLGGQR